MKYTAVFEFKEEPDIKKSDSWLGGELCSVQFSDALEELDALHKKMDELFHPTNHGFWDLPAGERAQFMEEAAARCGVENFYDLSPEERDSAYER
jgi:hypothetical protein